MRRERCAGKDAPMARDIPRRLGVIYLAQLGVICLARLGVILPAAVI